MRKSRTLIPPGLAVLSIIVVVGATRAQEATFTEEPVSLTHFAPSAGGRAPGRACR